MKSLILSLSILIVTISIKAQDSLFMQNQNGSISIGAGEWLIESGNNIHSKANLTLNFDIETKKTADTLNGYQEKSSISLGSGLFIYKENPFNNRISTPFDISLNLDIYIYKLFFLKTGIDVLNITSRSAGLIYLGPDLKINLLKKKINILIDIGLTGMIIIGSSSEGGIGLGFFASAYLSPSFKYEIGKTSFGLDLRNYLLSDKTYIFNPLITIKYRF